MNDNNRPSQEMNYKIEYYQQVNQTQGNAGSGAKSSFNMRD